MCGVQIVKAVSSFSLLVLAAFCLCADYGKMAGDLNEKNAHEIAQQVVDDPNSTEDAHDWARYILDNEKPSASDVANLRSALSAMANEDKVNDILSDTHAKSVAKQIKENRSYIDAGTQKDANWIEKAFERLKNLKGPDMPKVNLPKGEAPALNGLMIFVWILLGGGVLFLLIWAIRHFSWKRTLERKAKAMLEEDEPERTVDEWLEMADSLIAEGRYREAVRCLYLACLLRFDEFGVARFDRSQTNWEHLYRIRASIKLPKDIRFEPATQRFDVIWYGNRTAKIDDVSQFKAWYEEILGKLKENPA